MDRWEHHALSAITTVRMANVRVRQPLNVLLVPPIENGQSTLMA